METIGKFRIIEKIGEGGMGRVYLALDPVLTRKVAIKLIAMPADADSPERQAELHERFTREARMIGSLQHPNIVTLFDFGEEEGTLYMAMEYLQGTDLKRVMLSGTSVSIPSKIDVFKQVSEGLAYAHSRGVIHRDLKPGNIHLLDSGLVKIVDFGLARMSDSEITKTGIVVGTPYYMSPEQIRGRKVDPRSDLFSLGSVMYEFLCGQRPFKADSMSALLTTILTADPLPLQAQSCTIPEGFERVVLKCLAKNPDARYQDANEVVADLESLVKSMEEKLDTIDRGNRPVNKEISTAKLAVVPEPPKGAADLALAPPEPSHLRLDVRALSGPVPSISSFIRATSTPWWKKLAAVLLVAAAITGIGILLHRRQQAAAPRQQTYEEIRPEPRVVPDATGSSSTEESKPPASLDDTDTANREQKAVEQPAVVSEHGTQPPASPPPKAGRTSPSSRGSERATVSSVVVSPPRPAPQRPPSDVPSQRGMTGVGAVRVRILNPPEGVELDAFIDGDTVAADDPSAFLIDDLSAGVHTLTVKCQGHANRSAKFEIHPDTETSITLDLAEN